MTIFDQTIILQDFYEINNSTGLYKNFDFNSNQTIPMYAAQYPNGIEANYTFYNYKNNINFNLTQCDISPATNFQLVVYFMYIFIFLAALIGNGIVCLIVQSLPRMRTVTNYFIANLAVGDILMSLFCIPPSFISLLILEYWPFGSIFCQLVNYSQAVSVLVSAYTLVAISVDRYIALMWPLRPRISKREAKYIIVVVWIIALLTSLPIPIFSKLEQPQDWHKECNKYVCMEMWPELVLNYYYTFVLMALQFKIPLTVLIFTYTRIAFAIWGKRPPGEAENSRDQRMAKSKRKVGKKLQNVLNS